MAKPRLRIAPSPTGAMHIGTARTALYNWLLARRYGGQFIVRIEDTDKTRSKKDYEQDILSGLKWLGLNWNEGPEIGGPCAPYYQSERAEYYQAALRQLLKSGRVFYCFHSKAELAKERETQDAAKQPPVHWCDHRELAIIQAEAKLKAGERGVIRFKSPKETVIFEDLIRGEIATSADLLGDFVIAKSLTEPLYNFAAVVDDNAMRITHVLRGEEHIANTPKQILMYQALSYEMPAFAHLPLILAEDRSKMSKRMGHTALTEYRQLGYLPEAIVNFIALLGWNPGGDKEIFTLKELVDIFSLERIRKSGSIFDKVKLDWFNGKFLRQLSVDKFIEAAQPFVQESGGLKIDGETIIDRAGLKWTKSQVAKIITGEQTRVKRLAEVKTNVSFYFEGRELNYDKTLLNWRDAGLAGAKTSLEAVYKIMDNINEGDWSKATLEKSLMPLADKAANRGEVLWPLRVALSGQKNSSGPFEIAENLGKKLTLARIKFALVKLV